MIKKLTCIECPIGCQLEVDIEGGHVIKVTGNKCEKGPVYAQQEIENPMRILTSTVQTEGSDVKMLPVRTSGPIPKAMLFEAMEAVKQLRVAGHIEADEVIVPGFLGLKVDLISTRKI